MLSGPDRNQNLSRAALDPADEGVRRYVSTSEIRLRVGTIHVLVGAFIHPAERSSSPLLLRFVLALVGFLLVFGNFLPFVRDP